MSEAVRTPGGPGYTQISPTYDPYGAPYPPPQPAQTPRNGAKAPVLLAVIAVVVAVAGGVEEVDRRPAGDAGARATARARPRGGGDAADPPARLDQGAGPG